MKKFLAQIIIYGPPYGSPVMEGTIGGYQNVGSPQ